MRSLRSAFPEEFLVHALAVKANSLRGVLREAGRLGLGGEAASLQEAKHCLSLGQLVQSSAECSLLNVSTFRFSTGESHL